MKKKIRIKFQGGRSGIGGISASALGREAFTRWSRPDSIARGQTASSAIGMKTDVNDQCQRPSEAARYPQTFEPDGKDRPASPPPGTPP